MTDANITVTKEIQEQIADALKLLDFVVESGFKAADGQNLAEDIVTKIKTAAARISSAEAKPDESQTVGTKGGGSISAADWAEFELTYYKLAMFARPVTAQTLRDTEVTEDRLFVPNLSPAYRFSKLLWLMTIGFACFTVATDWGLHRYGPVQDGDVDTANSLLQLMQILIPFAYGGLGSCVYLLKSAHTYIHDRTFDVRRRPEYFNRIILGTISGGAIMLFVSQLSADDGTLIQLSSAALGFLAGYSTDFLFNAIERVIAAILPKVGISTVRQTAPAPKSPLDITSGGLTLKDLVDRFERAQGADKDLYKSLIEKLRERT